MPAIFYAYGMKTYAKLTQEVLTISKETRINEEIRDKELRVIDETGEMIGIMSRDEALRLAEEKKLDLVNISPNAKPPVCKILDYGKYRYEMQKREKEAKKKQKETELKEVGLKLTTDVHDVEVKRKMVVRFLTAGDRVKVNIRFRGREMAFQNKGYEVMNSFAESVTEYGSVDRPPKIEGRNMVMYLSPAKKK